ncbi:NlpC/P60 family protein [Psychrobacillus antarcticus]|uniref:NlpC/P60 family protein n=1 Tax=Psychrobacillus antarcticus TaxID=2879115 RepID=UPI00240860B4|nr:NlpC/P60 family protein [Psychrobacillus antarcticus]
MEILKKFIVLVVTFFLLLSVGSSVSAAPLYKDVGDDYFAKAELDFLVSEGILVGDPTKDFGLGQELKRLEAAEMLVKALRLEVNSQSELVISDVPSDHISYPVIAAIVENGTMKLDENGAFNPNAPISRGESAVFFVRGFNITGTTKTPFVDVLPEYWVSESIQALQANNIAIGYPDNSFKPLVNITKEDFAILLARVLNPDFRKAATPTPVPIPTASCEKPSQVKKAFVNVQVTSLWHKPNINRPVDKSSISTPVNITEWTKSMNLTQKKWLIGKTDTQALFGDEVVILKKSGKWTRIAVKDQYVPYQKEGYPGWVPSSHLAETTTDTSECPIAIVNAKSTNLYQDTKKNKVYIPISYTTILPVVKEEGEWLHVMTPTNGIKYLAKKDAKVYKNYAAVPKPSQKDIVNSAKQFLDLPYLWAGTSAYGFDCSGIIYSVYKNHGILIPRDSFYQATKGTSVSKKNLQSGDLVFFAGNGGKGKVYHVGLYVGDGKMLHAPYASSKVKIESMNTGTYKKNYSGARRYLK